MREGIFYKKKCNEPGATLTPGGSFINQGYPTHIATGGKDSQAIRGGVMAGSYGTYGAVDWAEKRNQKTTKSWVK